MYKGQVLDGYFPIDSEGVSPAKELILIKNGILKNMLNDRIPTLKNSHSNGHKRFSINSTFNKPPFDRPSMQVFPGVIHFTAQETFTEAELKQKLIEAARKAGLKYAYIINSSANNDGIRVYVEDGREELVRGIYYPVHSYEVFKNILGASEEEYISTGWSRASISSYILPKSILFEKLEISKKRRSKSSTHSTILL